MDRLIPLQLWPRSGQREMLPAPWPRFMPWLLLAMVLLLLGTTLARADERPPGCTGSALGIILFTDSKDVHIGESITYSVTVFNGLPGSTKIACDATGITASVVTADGVTHPITLRRTELSQGDSDFYPNVVTYIVRAEDILPDGTVRATAVDQGDIHQNDTNSRGGGNQGLNSEVVQPCIVVTAVCTGSVGENGAITFTGTVANCGNAPLDNVTVSNKVNGILVKVLGPVTLGIGQSVPFTGNWIPLNPCAPSTAVVTATGTDNLTIARTVTSSASTTCQNVLTPGIKVTKACPPNPVAPGQLLVYSGSVTNTGDVTLTNVVVVGDHPAANTVLFTAAILAPGAGATFTGSYIAPVDCSTTSSVTATGSSVCGTPVTSTASSTCPILTTPKIKLLANCPPGNLAPGSSVTYSGSVSNSGNIPLKNVVVVSDQPAANTRVLSVDTLAPGASANFTATYTVPANGCSITTTLGASGHDLCTDAVTTDTTAITCGVNTTPKIAVTLACPPTTASSGGPITYSGTVSNTGDVILKNVTIVSAQATPGTVLTVATLAPGASTNFTFSFTTPADACSVTATVTASGADNCTSVAVTNTASATCPLLTVPGIAITQNCPVNSVGPGGLFSYTGTVRNTGNVTLTNVVVSGPTSVITPPPVTNAPSMVVWVDDSLPAGANTGADGGDSWNFVSQDPAPFSGALAHKSNVNSGMHQHYFTGATQGFSIDPTDILVTYVYIDPQNIPDEIMLQWYDVSFEHRAFWGQNLVNQGELGTVQRLRMGDMPEAGKWVRLEVPAQSVGLGGHFLHGMAFTLSGGRATWDASGKATSTAPGGSPGIVTTPGTTVFTVATLAPGQTVPFTGSYTVPLNAGCSVTTVLSVSGNDKCTGIAATATSSNTCPLETSPAIVVTHNCPDNPGVQGGLLTFTGSVRNTGNVTLTNVVVRDDRVGPTPVFTVASMAPGVSATFTGSYVIPANCCSVSSTLTATGSSVCTGESVSDTATATCPVATTPGIAVTKACANLPLLEPGDRFHYSGTVSNTGNITLTNVTVVDNKPAANTLVLGPITLAPGETVKFAGSYIIPTDFCGTDTVTANGFDSCSGVAVSNTATATCPVTTTPQISVIKNCPAEPTPRGGTHIYTGTVRNSGNVTLINVFVVDSQPSNNTPVLGPITLAPGASRDFTGSYTAPMDCCETTDTLAVRGEDFCSGVVVTDSSSAICPLLTTPALAVTEICPTTPVITGGTFIFHGMVANSGDVNLTNVLVFSTRPGGIKDKVLGPVELAPGESADFTGSYVVQAGETPASNVILATGVDTCQVRTVTAKANCAGPVNFVLPLLRSVTFADGMTTLSWDAAPGTMYKVQCKGILEDPIWIDVPGNVLATGNSATKTDNVGPTAKRFYRVTVVE